MSTLLPVLNELQPISKSDAPSPSLRVGDVARRTGKTVRALHLYEELGLLEPDVRTAAGYRLYTDEAVTRVHWISKLQEMGFSLTAIRKMVDEWKESGSAPTAMRTVMDLYRAKLEETREQLEKLKSLEGELLASIHYLETCDTCDPMRLVRACGTCEVHSCNDQPPELVRGLQVVKKEER